MSWPLQKMSVAEFAAFEQSQGQRIVKSGGVYWRRVRPGFYRALLHFCEYPASSVSAPWPSLLGGFQYAPPAGEPANSLLNLLIFENPQSYSLNKLDRHERREVRRANEVFEVRTVPAADQFTQKAYPVYLSFYERTRYQYKPERRDRACFSRWSELIYRNPKTIVLGAYKKDGELGAIGIWHLVEDTLVYTTFFSDTESLKLHVTGLMLHAMRSAAVACDAVKQIFVGMNKSGGRLSVDDFYLTRGCTLVRKPAFLHLNPLAKIFLRKCMPNRYFQLRGLFEGEPEPNGHFNHDTAVKSVDMAEGCPQKEPGTSANRLESRF